MQRTLLQTVTSFCERRAIPIPSTVIGNSDRQVIQVRGLLEEGGRQLAQRGPWEGLTRECVLTTIASEDQGLLTTLAPGYSWMLPETLWDRTNKRTLIGRLTPAQWQYVKAILIAGPLYTFRTRGGRFLVNPAPPAGENWAFEYIMETWIQQTGGGSFLAYFDADTNNILLPDDVVQADLLWRWKKEKGQTFAQDFDDCEDLIAKALGRDGGQRPPVDASSTHSHVQPGVFIPQYNTVP